MSGPVVSFDADAIPDELKERDQWLQWDASADTPRRPHWNGDFTISWSDPDAWHSFEEAQRSAELIDSWGIGYVMALENADFDGEYGCIDIDNGLDENGRPKEWLPDLTEFIESGAYIERSPSGTGLHIPVIGYEPPPWWADCQRGDHEGVDYLTNKFCTFTGDTIDVSGSDVYDGDCGAWFWDAYKAVKGESPPIDHLVSGETARASGDHDEWLTDEHIQEALERINPDLAYKEWVSIGYAVHDYDPSQNGKRLFESWSRKGSKWDGQAQRVIEDLWSRAKPGNGITVATLVHKAKSNGWTPKRKEKETRRKQAPDEVPEGDNPAELSQVSVEEIAGVESVTDDTDETEDTTGWPWVIQLFESDENNSTTKAYHAAVEQLEAEHTIKTIRESDEIYFYDEDLGYYLRKGQTYIRELVDQCLGEHANDNRKREITSKWRDRHYISVDELKAPKGKVNIENGVLDLETREITEHSPEYYFTNRLNVDRPATDEELDGNEWVKQVERALEDAGEREKLHQFIYYCLQTWHCEHEKAAFFVGPPRTGKSTLQEGIQALFGTQPTVSNLTPQQIADTQFDAAALFDAALNTVNDINATPIKDSGALKRIFSGERTKMENKYKDAFFGESTAKHLFTANWLPRIVGTDESIFRRLLIFEFTKQIPEDEKDPRHKRTIKESKNVRRVILRKALDAGETLEANAAFTNDRSAKDTRELWDKWRSNSKLFLYTHFEITADPDDTVEKRSYWQAYNEYCAKNDHEPKSNMGVTKELEYVPGIGTSDDTHYIGLRWDEPDKPETRQAGLDDAQDPRIRKLKGWVDQFSTPVAGADPQEVIEYAETQGYESDRIADDINTLREEGQLYESDGGIRRVD